MYESAHVEITFQLLEMSSITTPNQISTNIHTRYTLQRVFFRKNSCDFTNHHSEKKSFWKFRLNRIVLVTGTHVKFLPTFVNVAALLYANIVCLSGPVVLPL